MHPYRTPIGQGGREDRGTWELAVPFGLVWVLAAARVASAVIGGRTFGAVDTLASLSLVLLPWLLSRRA